MKTFITPTGNSKKVALKKAELNKEYWGELHFKNEIFKTEEGYFNRFTLNVDENLSFEEIKNLIK